MNKHFLTASVCVVGGLMLSCGFKARKEARQFISGHFQIQQSDIGHLSILAPSRFVREETRQMPGAPLPGPAEDASSDAYGVRVSIEPNNVKNWGTGTPTKSQVEQVFEGFGKKAEVGLHSVTLDDHPGILATSTALGFDKPQWAEIYFGSDGLTIQVSGAGTGDIAKQVCDEVIRSTKFEH